MHNMPLGKVVSDRKDVQQDKELAYDYFLKLPQSREIFMQRIFLVTLE